MGGGQENRGSHLILTFSERGVSLFCFPHNLQVLFRIKEICQESKSENILGNKFKPQSNSPRLHIALW